MSLDRIATMACQKKVAGKPRNPDCGCEPCRARREVFGINIPCQIQEMARQLAKKLNISLHEAAEIALEEYTCPPR